AEISVFHAIRYPIDWYLSLYPHDPDPAWYVLFDIRDEMRGFFCGVGLVLSSLPFLIELCSRGNQAWIDLQHVRFEIRVCKNSPERVQIAFGVAAREPQHHMIPDLDSGIFQNLRCLNNISDSMISMNFLVHIIVQCLDSNLNPCHTHGEHVINMANPRPIRSSLNGNPNVPNLGRFSKILCFFQGS